MTTLDNLVVVESQMPTAPIPTSSPPQSPKPTASTPSSPNSATAHDAEFYFDDQLVTLLVENQLFRVHQHFLTRDSDFFRGMFSLPTPPGVIEGQSDDKPIVLEGVTIKEFRCLMRFLYNSMYGPSIRNLDEWTALLSISTRYVFDKIRDLAIDEVSPKVLDPIKKIILATKYSIPQWLPPAYVDLCKRPEPLTDREAEALGLRTVVRVAKAREIVREKCYVTTTLRSYYPHDRIYTFNDRGILAVVEAIWPECHAIAQASTSPIPGQGTNTVAAI